MNHSSITCGVRVMLIVIYAFVLMSCEKTLDYSGEMPEDKLVVLARGQSGDVLHVGLTTSSFSLKETASSVPLTEAKVSYSLNGGDYVSMAFSESVDYMGKTKGEYLSETKFFSRDTVDLKVEYPTFPTATGRTIFPPKVNFTLEAKSLSRNEESEVVLSLEDDESTDYYQITAYMAYQQYGGMTYSSPMTVKSSDVIFKTEEDWSSMDQGQDVVTKLIDRVCFSDEFFKNQTKAIRLELAPVYNTNNKLNLDYQSVNMKLYVVVSTYPRDYYLYNKAQHLYEDHEGDYFSEPVQMYHNIVHGYGIIYGQTQWAVGLNVPQ